MFARTRSFYSSAAQPKSLFPVEATQLFLGRSLRKTINATSYTWSTYRHGLDFYPRFTATLTGGLLWGLGDIFVQKKIDQVEKFEYTRFWGSVMYGSIITGFLAYYWYNAIHWIVHDKLKLAPKTAKFIAAKIFLELGINAPVSLVCFWTIMGKMDGQKMRDIIQNMGENNKYFDSLTVDWLLWLPLDVVNFGIVPVKYQILAINAGCLIEAVILGKMEADAAKREQEEAERKEKLLKSKKTSSSCDDSTEMSAAEHKRTMLLREKAAALLDGKKVRCVLKEVHLGKGRKMLHVETKDGEKRTVEVTV